MNPHELDQLLRRIPVPDRDEQYWKEFPETVTRRLKAEAHRRSSRPPVAPAPSRQPSRWVWALGLPAAAAILLLAIPWKRSVAPDEQLQRLRVCYHQVAPLFPNQLEAVVLTAQGAQLQLSERPDVPASPPLFVRVCAPSKPGASAAACATAVSFSGQKIQLAGQEFEILANGRGEIFLLAKEGVLVPGQALVGGEKWRFETGWLEGVL